MDTHLPRLLVALLGVCALGGLGFAGWAGFNALARWQSGWTALTQRFPAREIHKLGEKYSGQWAHFYRRPRHSFKVNRGISLELAEEGVLVTASFARHAPILILWPDIFEVDQTNLFGSQNTGILAHYDKNTTDRNNFVRFSLPPPALATVMKHVPAELLQKKNLNSFSDLLSDRMKSAQKPPWNS